MKITNIRTICLSYPYENPIADGYSSCGGRSALLVFVDTDKGLTGLGECATFGASLSAMSAIIDAQLKPLLVGRDPSRITELWERMVLANWANGRMGIVLGAISGIDIALWDLLGKMAGLPIYKLLGGVSDRVRCYASAGFYAEGKTVDDLRREVDGYLHSGYTAFKMKVGRTDTETQYPHKFLPKGDWLISYEEDMKRVAAVREEIGMDKNLMLDMNGTWTVGEVLRREEDFDRYNIYWIEEPIQNTDFNGYREIRNKLRHTMVAASESQQGLDTYRAMFEADAVDVVQANLGWAGGFTMVRKISALAEAYHKLFTPHTFFSAVMTAANVQFAASLTNMPFIESEENPNPLRTQLLLEPLERDNQMNYILSDRPGLGISLNMDTIRKYQIA